jgi:hypothetical protein
MKETPGFEVVILRPAGIMKRGFFTAVLPVVVVDVADMGVVLVAAAVRDGAVPAAKEDGGEVTLENGEIQSIAKALRASSAVSG